VVSQEVKCPACGSAFWVGAAEVVAADAPPEVADDFLPPPDVLPASTEGEIVPGQWPPRTPPRPRTPPKRSSLGCMIVIGIFGLGAALWSSMVRDRDWPARNRIFEDDEERRQQVRQAFQQADLPADAELTRELQTFFTSLGDALRAKNANLIVGHFNTERMLDELRAQGAMPRGMAHQRERYARDMGRGLGQALAHNDVMLVWNATDIRSIKKLPGNEVVVVVRHRSDEAATLKFRWWLTRESGSWEIYDYEDLDMGLRMSALLAVVVQDGADKIWQYQQATNNLRAAMVALGQSDPDTAERKLRAVPAITLPKTLEAARLFAEAMVRLQREQCDEALVFLDKARACHPDMPILDLMKGCALNRLGKWDQALPFLEAYHDLLGDDDAIDLQLGEALRGVRRFPEAAAAYRKGLDYNPKNSDAFLGLLNSLAPNDPRDDIPARFARLDKPHDIFVTVAEEMREDHNGTALDQIAEAMRKLEPNFAAVDYYQALAKAWTGHPDQAVPLFRSALQREKNADQRRSYVTPFLQAMIQAGKPLDAYGVAPDPKEAFLVLAAELKKSYRTDDLKTLVATHRRKHKDEPLLPFYEGEVLVREGKYPLAEKAFALGMANPPDRATLTDFRASRVLARYHTGRALSAYEEIGPQHETFDQLAALFYGDRNADQLQELIDLHAQAAADAPRLVRPRWRLQLLRDKPSEAATVFNAASAAEKDEKARQSLVSDFLLDMLGAQRTLEGYAAAPDQAHAFQFLAEELLEEDRRDDLQRLIEAHRRRHPDDVMLCFYTGTLHRLVGDWEQAARVLVEGWKKAPANVRTRFRWNYVEALGKTSRAIEAYRAVEPRKDTFIQLANLLADDRKGAELQALIEEHRPHAKDEAQLFFQEARAKVLLDQVPEAFALLNQAYKKQSVKEQRNWYVTRIVEDLAATGKGLKAYKLAPDRRVAFEALARILHDDKKTDELQELLNEHAKHSANDVQSLYYWGELYLARGDLNRANRHFCEALTMVTPQTQWMVRNGLYRTRVRSGQAAETYKEYGPGTLVFEALARVCLQEQNGKQLGTLIAAHRQAQPDDAVLPVWDLEVQWLARDYEGALKLLTDQRDGVFATAQHRWKHDDYLIRCLVRLKRTDEAVKEAEALTKSGRGNRVLLILARAARGGAAEALAALRETRSNEVRAEDCYQDPDLGPLLRSEPFSAFRKQYPEPKQAAHKPRD
jgi:tetratricopeptide (TPR) repeat protein